MPKSITVDANTAVASVAHRLSEVIAIYPITPSSTMGELADEWSAKGHTNLWGRVPRVVEMQSEGGAAGAVHGAVTAGALSTTFTASQGLLLMIPDMFKIAGELTPFVMHVAARSVATHALSIFGDHSDVMACRSTGFAMLAAASVQEAQDLAVIAHAATLRSRIPFLHFFDGFRTSHEVAKIETVEDDVLRALVDEKALAAHRARGLTPDAPVLRGTAQNPDTFFQAREAANPTYDACAAVVEETMARFGELTGRRYHAFEYHGHPEAERVIVAMGSATETALETVDYLLARGERVGVLRVRLYRPFDAAALVAALPASVRTVAVLDRTKEPGAHGDPLFLDVLAGLAESGKPLPRVVAGRYGLSSKELTPAMLVAVFEALASATPLPRFTVGIEDDVTHRSLRWDRSLDIEPVDVVRAIVFGLGSDGTVGSNKNTIQIIGEETDHFAQGYFVYDSRKAGAVTVSHLRFGPRPIRSAYLVQRAPFVACHHPTILERHDVLEHAMPGATFLLNAPWSQEEAWDRLPREVQEEIVEKRVRFYVIDASAVAAEAGLGRHVGTILQACFFALTGVLPMEEAMAHVKRAIRKSYGKRGESVIEKNERAIDRAVSAMRPVRVPADAGSQRHRPLPVARSAPDFVQRVTAAMLAGRGDLLPVSAFPIDGTWPTGTAKWEKRSLAPELPKWDASLCIQCNKCAFVCPHAAIRTIVCKPEDAAKAPDGTQVLTYKAKEQAGLSYVVQVAPDDCTGCSLCVEVCPAKDKGNPRHKSLDMVPAGEIREAERPRWDWASSLPPIERAKVHLDVKGSQLVEPLFEFSLACSGCGETPYLKLLTQLFGDRMVVANATGCSSIFGGNLPTTPWSVGRDGRGPAWSNSLFEDNAEFGLGTRLALDAHRERAAMLLRALATEVGETLATEILAEKSKDDVAIARQRERVVALRQKLAAVARPEALELAAVADHLVPKSVWIVGGDGWAYDIGYGGLDHVLASDADVNVLVLDTEVYSNTGGQQSKATPLGASAKFAMAGKSVGKKDLGMMAMSYGHVYVARVAFGAKDKQTVDALREAESWHGPSLVIAYSHCIAHGYDMAHGLEQQRLAVESGVWPLYRFDPRRLAAGQAPLVLDGAPPETGRKARVRDYMQNEGRFRAVELTDPERHARLVAEAEREVERRLAIYRQLSTLHAPAVPR